MKSIGPVELPLKGIEIVNKQSDIMDVLLDLHIPNMATALNSMLGMNLPQILAVNKEEMGVVGIVAYQPPEKWKTHEDQQMIMFLAPNTSKLAEYFINWHNNTPDPFQRQAIATIIHYIDKLVKINQQRKAAQPFFTPGSSSTT